MAEKNNPRSDSEKGIESSRRKYLKGIGITGVGMAGYAAQSSASSNDTTEIVTLRDSDGPVETEKVSTEWWEQVQTARKVRDGLEKRYEDENDIVLVGLTVGERSIGGKLMKQVRVGTRGPSTNVNIPEEVDGVSIVVENDVSMDWEACYLNNYDPAKGGVALNSDYGGGSACCAAYKDGNQYMMSARHVFLDSGNGCDNTEAQGEPMYQVEDYFGDVSDEYLEHDSVFVTPASDEGVSDGIVNESAPIEGWVTQSGLDSFSSDGTTVKGRFAASCTATAQIDSYDNTYSCSNNALLTELVELDGDYTQGGDSGGIIYFVSDKGNAFVVNLHSGDLVDNHSSGAAAYAIHEYQGYSFGNQ